MDEAIIVLEQIRGELNRFRELPRIPWERANRKMLVSRMQEWQNHTSQMKEFIKILGIEKLKQPELKNIELKEAEAFIESSNKILERNIAFEKEKAKRKIDLTEPIATSALAIELEARMQRQWLSIQKVIEQAQISLKNKYSTGNVSKGIEQDLFKLINTKEEEIQLLKKERDLLKREKYFGTREKYSLTELENELQEIMQKFAVERHALQDQLEASKKLLDEYSTHHLKLENKNKKMEQLVHELSKKHIDIITTMKKERDCSQKLMLDMESEAASMRALYNKGLLELEEKKHSIKQEAIEKHAHRIAQLEKKEKEYEQHIRELTALLKEKERQLQREKLKKPKKEEMEEMTSSVA